MRFVAASLSISFVAFSTQRSAMIRVKPVSHIPNQFVQASNAAPTLASILITAHPFSRRDYEDRTCRGQPKSISDCHYESAAKDALFAENSVTPTTSFFRPDAACIVCIAAS